jgi:hypothetical protein
VLVPDKEKHGFCNLERKLSATKRVALQPAENSRRTTGRCVSDAKNKATGKQMCITYILYSSFPIGTPDTFYCSESGKYFYFYFV